MAQLVNRPVLILNRSRPLQWFITDHLSRTSCRPCWLKDRIHHGSMRYRMALKSIRRQQQQFCSFRWRVRNRIMSCYRTEVSYELAAFIATTLPWTLCRASDILSEIYSVTLLVYACRVPEQLLSDRIALRLHYDIIYRK